VALPEAVARWIARLVTATHPGAAEATPRVRTYVRYGASPRAAIALAEAARAAALLAGRPSVGFEDVKMLVEPVLNHRLILNYQARLDQVTASALSQELAAALDPAGMRLPQGVEVKA
jgi:MoxR-like ATPase